MINETASEQCIVRKHEYIHHPSQLCVVEHEVVSGTPPPSFVRFGTAVVHTMTMPNGQQMQGRRQIRIDADDVEMAFNMLAPLIRDAIKDIESEARQALLTQGMPATVNNRGRM